MKLSALILAAVSGLIFLASAVSASSVVAATVSSTLRYSPSCPSGSLKVLLLKTPFNPASNTVPTDSGVPIPPDVQSDLNAAFSAAPAGFQAQLCGLSGIFIDPTDCTASTKTITCNFTGADLAADHSWGLRIYNPAPTSPSSNPGPRYIGLSLGLWDYNDPHSNIQWNCPPMHYCAAPFQTFQIIGLEALLYRANNNGVPRGSPPTVTVVPSSFAASSAMGVLTALAHEFGYVLWFDTFVQPPGNATIENTFCGSNFYPSGNWGSGADNQVSVPYNRWVPFGYPSGNAGSDVQSLPNLLASGGYQAAAEALHNIYHSGQWASTLAAFSPVADFVETFELSVITAAGLQQLAINSDNILPPGPTLATKLACF